MKLLRLHSLFPIVALLFSFVTQAAWEKDKTYTITVLHTNDHHGHFWQSSKGEYGLAAQKTLVDQIRKDVAEKGGNLLVLSGGDINTGVPESDMVHAEPDFLGMNEVGYDAMAVGNHEFDNPLDILLKQRDEWAKFPFLSANIYYKDTGKRVFEPYKIFERQGLKIAVIGLTTDDTPRLGSEEKLAGLNFTNPQTEIRKILAEIKETEKPDIIIAATHMGHYEDGNHGSNAPGDVEMARSLDHGALDMIVGGHSQEPLCMEEVNVRQKDYVPGTPCMPDNQNGIWIVQAHEWGKYVGRADFTFQNGKLILSTYELIPVNLKKSVKDEEGKTTYVNYGPEIAQDAKVLELLEPFQKKGEEMLGVEIGKTDVFLEGSRNIVRYQQTNLGKLVVKAQMARTNADFGVISGGGVRASIEAGPISYRDVLTVQPFGNVVGYAEMTGAEVMEWLNVVGAMSPGSGAYPQFANIYFKLNDGKVSDVVIGDKPLDLKKTYRISMPNYNAEGGDGYPKLGDKFITTGFIDAEILKDYIANLGTITEKDFG